MTPLFALTEHLESIALIDTWGEDECVYQLCLRNSLTRWIKSELLCDVIASESRRISRRLRVFRGEEVEIEVSL